MAIPVSLEDAKNQLRVDLDDTTQDVEIVGFITDAADWVEQYTGIVLEAREVTETFSGVKPATLKAWPVSATAIPIVTYDGLPVIAPRLDVSRRPARVWPSTGILWPFRRSDQIYSVSIRAGYEADEVVPGNLRRAMLVLIGAYDADREGGDILAKAEATARRLCDRFKVRAL